MNKAGGTDGTGEILINKMYHVSRPSDNKKPHHKKNDTRIPWPRARPGWIADSNVEFHESVSAYTARRSKTQYGHSSTINAAQGANVLFLT